MDIIKKWLREFFEAHGRYPNGSSGDVSPCGKTWKSLDRLIKKRFAEKGTGPKTLSDLKNEFLGLCKGNITEIDICNWMLRFQKKHNRWPSYKDADSIAEPFGVRQGTIEGWLRDGMWMLPGNSSLAKLREKMLAKESKRQKASA